LVTPTDAHHRDDTVRPAVGVGVMVMRNNQVLLGRRRGAHGQGTFGWPGGGLEFGESLIDAVKREALEEAGLNVQSCKLVCVSNVVEYERHYLDLEFQVTEFSGEPVVREPQYTESWNWYALDALPSPLFRPCELALASLKTSNMLNDSH
jgi:8-oxo-dGTP diphosphatase